MKARVCIGIAVPSAMLVEVIRKLDDAAAEIAATTPLTAVGVSGVLVSVPSSARASRRQGRGGGRAQRPRRTPTLSPRAIPESTSIVGLRRALSTSAKYLRQPDSGVRRRPASSPIATWLAGYARQLGGEKSRGSRPNETSTRFNNGSHSRKRASASRRVCPMFGRALALMLFFALSVGCKDGATAGRGAGRRLGTCGSAFALVGTGVGVSCAL